jgi:hypothetical protein
MPYALKALGQDVLQEPAQEAAKSSVAEWSAPSSPPGSAAQRPHFDKRSGLASSLKLSVVETGFRKQL